MRVIPFSMATSSTCVSISHNDDAERSYLRNGRTRRCALRWRSKCRRVAGAASAARLALPALARLGGVDAEHLQEPPPSRRGDENGVAALHPFHPAEIEAARGDRGGHRAREMRASLGPVETEPGETVASRARCGELDP